MGPMIKLLLCVVLLHEAKQLSIDATAQCYDINIVINKMNVTLIMYSKIKGFNNCLAVCSTHCTSWIYQIIISLKPNPYMNLIYKLPHWNLAHD